MFETTILQNIEWKVCRNVFIGNSAKTTAKEETTGIVSRFGAFSDSIVGGH